MISRQKIKVIATFAAREKVVSKDIVELVLTKMEKQELKLFFFYYKSEIDKKTAYVTSALPLSDESIKQLQEQLKGKDLVFKSDETLGAGFILKEDDTVVDFSVKNYINETIEKLKN